MQTVCQQNLDKIAGGHCANSVLPALKYIFFAGTVGFTYLAYQSCIEDNEPAYVLPLIGSIIGFLATEHI